MPMERKKKGRTACDRVLCYQKRGLGCVGESAGVPLRVFIIRKTTSDIKGRLERESRYNIKKDLRYKVGICTGS